MHDPQPLDYDAIRPDPRAAKRIETGFAGVAQSRLLVGVDPLRMLPCEPFDAEAVSISACCSRDVAGLFFVVLFERVAIGKAADPFFNYSEGGWMCLQGGG